MAINNASKFDRFIVFSKEELPSYCAIKISLVDCEIEILNKKMPIKVVDDFKVSIRPCEFKSFENIFGESNKISTGNNEYCALMDFLTKTKFSLVEVIDFEEIYYNELQLKLCEGGKTRYIFDILDKCRELSRKKSSGNNVVRYLLLHMHNEIIKKQLGKMPNNLISYLYLKNGCLPFDTMPYATSLLVETLQNGHTVIKFSVNRYNEQDDDIENNTIVPFRIAYAISIQAASSNSAKPMDKKT